MPGGGCRCDWPLFFQLTLYEADCACGHPCRDAHISKEVLPIARTYETGVEIPKPQTHLGSYRPLLQDQIKICMWWFLTKGQKRLLVAR